MAKCEAEDSFISEVDPFIVAYLREVKYDSDAQRRNPKEAATVIRDRVAYNRVPMGFGLEVPGSNAAAPPPIAENFYDGLSLDEIEKLYVEHIKREARSPKGAA